MWWEANCCCCLIAEWVREYERQWLAGENVVDWRVVVENGGIGIVCLSRMGGWFVMIWGRIPSGYWNWWSGLMAANGWRFQRKFGKSAFTMKRKLNKAKKMGLFVFSFSSAMGIKLKRFFYWVRGTGWLKIEDARAGQLKIESTLPLWVARLIKNWKLNFKMVKWWIII